MKNDIFTGGIRGVQSAADAVLSDPRVAALAVGGNIAVGTASSLELINGFLSVASLAVGVMTGFVICIYWSIKTYLLWRNRGEK